MKTRKLHRQIYKMPKPDHVPEPPEGYGYVGQGVPHHPIFEGSGGCARRIILEEEKRKTPRERKGFSDDGYPTDEWLKGPFLGVVKDAHYAIPMAAWAEIEYPPKGFDEYGIRIK